MTTSSPPPPPTADALAELMRLHGDDAKHKIDEQFGGLDGLCKSLGTDARQGLPNEAAVNERREKFGPNSIPTAASKSLWRLIWEATQDLTLFILIIAAIVSLVLTLVSPSAQSDDDDDSSKKKKEEGGNVEWIESVAIMVSVVLVVMVKALNDWSKEKQFRALQSKLDTDQRVTVVRAGEHVELPIAELVVGDIVQVQYGATLPADGLVLQGNDLKVDESSLTGESDQIRKGHDSDPVLLSGTNVMEGRGTMLVTAVGLHSQTGMIFQLLGAADAGDKGSENKKKGKNLHQNVHPPGRATNGTVYGASAETIVDHRQDFGSKTGGQMFGRPPAADNAASQSVDGSVSLQRLNTRSEMSLADVDEEEEQTVTKTLDDDADEEENAKGKHQSVLQAKLTKLTVQIGKLGTLAALACVIVLIVKFCIRTYAVEKKPFRTSHLSQFVKFLIIGVTVLVVAVPEGLPLAVTLSLAFSVRIATAFAADILCVLTRTQKMMKDNNLVRHIDACETMGNATTICCDKTGTLTTNRMTTVQFFCANQYMEQIPYNERLPTPVVELLTESIAINTNYTTRVIPPQPGEREPTQVGNKTECALLGFVTALGVDYQQLRAAQPNNKFVKVFTFHSGRKAMGTLIKPNENEDVVRVHVKGASERVVGWCKFVLDEQGQPKPFSEADQKWLISNVIEKMANNGLRTIGIAYKDVHAQSGQYPVNEETLDPNEKCYDIDKDGKQVQVNSWIESEQKVFGNLTLLGVAGIEDPVREEVPEAIAKCQRAGITVRMLTGDNINTARSIAYKCGIVKPNDDAVILEGPDFNQRVRDSSGQVRQQLLDGIWPRLRVMARSQPQDKYTLVKGIIDSKLSEQREVVAVTGDGTNDGPALKVADVGFAMGITGTDVAKEASDIIITDDNFTSIVKAVMWGRNVYDSIAKFIQFQLTVNIVAVAVALISACAIDDTPLKAVQMLWVNLIMDTFASLALATEPPNEDLLKRKPYGRNQQLISMTMLVNIVGQSIYQLTVIMLLLYLGPQVFGFDSVVNTPQAEDPSIHFTMIYNTFVLMTLAFEIYARKVHGERNFLAGIWRNPFFIGIWILQLVVQVATVEIGGFVGVAMQTTRLPLYLWGWSAVIAVCALVWQELIVNVARCLPKSWAVGDRHVDVDRDPTVRNVFKSGARIDDKEVAETFNHVSSVAVTYMISLARLQSQISVEPRLRPTRPSQLSDNVRRRYVRQLTESRATRIRSDSSSDVYRSTGSRPDSIATDGTVFTRSMTVGDSVTNMSPQPSPSPVR